MFTWLSTVGASLVLLVWGIAGRTELRPRVAGLFGLIARSAPFALVLWVLADPAGRVIVNDFGAHPLDSIYETAVEESASNADAGGAGEFLQTKQAAGELFRYFGYLAPDGSNFQGHEVFMRPEVLPLLANNRAMRLELHDIQGYDPAQMERYRSFFEGLNGLERDYHEALVYPFGVTSPLLDILNVRYILIPAVIPPGRDDLQLLVATYPEVFRNEQVRVLENHDALPRAWLVHDVRQVSEERALELLASEAFDPRQTVLLEKPGPVVAPALSGANEPVTFTEYSNDRVRLSVNAASDGVMVLGDAFDPGWQVYVDGKRSDLYVANVALRAVAVSAGTHEVQFRYEPRSLRIGLAISGSTLLFMLGIVGFNLARVIGQRRGALQQRATTGTG